MPSRLVRQRLGTQRVANVCERTEGAIRKWDRRRSKGGLGGLVPAEFQARLLRLAEEVGADLEPHELIAEPVE